MRFSLMYPTAIAALFLAGGVAQADNMGEAHKHASYRDGHGSVPAPCHRPERTPTSSARKSNKSSCLRVLDQPVCRVPDARHMAVGPQDQVTSSGPERMRFGRSPTATRTGTADEASGSPPRSSSRASERPRASRRTGSSISRSKTACTRVPGGGILLREPGRGGRRSGQGRRSHSRRRRILQPHRPRMRNRAGQQALHFSSASRSRAAAGEGRRIQSRMASAASSGWIIRRNRESMPDGVRNPVGLDFNPATGELWTNDNQVDGMGDDIPPGELNQITETGQHFGFPWFGGGHAATVGTRTPSRRGCGLHSRRDDRHRPISAYCSTPATCFRRI